MPQYAFPADDYTPHGYLANPSAFARSWSHGEGGCLRTSRQHLGVGWQVPWALKAQASADLVVALECDGERLVTRADFEHHELSSPHHTSQLMTLRWQAFGQVWDASFVRVDADTLGLQLVWSPAPDATPQAVAPAVQLTIGVVGWRQPEYGGRPETHGSFVDLGEPFGAFQLVADVAWIEDQAGSLHGVQIPAVGPSAILTADAAQAAVAFSLDLTPSTGAAVNALMRRALRAGQAAPPDGSLGSAGALVGEAIGRARTADARFWSGAARLVGDWPDHWRRGWVYDLETTRMCIFSAGGVFTDVWPSWMIQWPRAVIAEGTLDMARLAYGSHSLAMRATLSLFRDAPADNAPCIFQHGEPNMVAADGSICATSPAWCVPFYNLERLYNVTLDRAWLAAIYPYLTRYLDWWLRERTDTAGWAVYKCTWEAGEDDTPRLDPERRGDNVVSAFVRPVELQAAMALSAGVLARFADALGAAADAERWRTIQVEFAARTARLWDAETGRYRDWDVRANAFLAASSPGEENYWGVDPCRYSALAFTPVLAGLTGPDQQDGLRRELRHYAGPPWTLWASWSSIVLEAATLLGERTLASDIAAGIIERVYAELDAREILHPTHPTPGVAREFWPLDLDSWASCEGYGWGANTATLLMRQVFGFLEGPATAHDAGQPSGTGWGAGVLRFSLAPCLPREFLVPGKEYRVANLPYQGGTLALGYRVSDTGSSGGPASLTLLIAAGVLTSCTVRDEHGTLLPSDGQPKTMHRLAGRNGARYQIELTAVLD
ncbi:MAG: hypothetical protein AB7K36_23760 [Chloroflexota bacterium]